jgi:hypothetical protein
LGAAAHRLRPIIWATIGILAAYAWLQLLVARAMTTSLWWQSEWLRIRLQHRYPKANLGPAPSDPTWQSWLPSATTAFILILSLVLLALALVSAGRGWWLFLVAGVPLVPMQMAPGTWAPALSNQLTYAIIWPAGATRPSTAWAWVSAAIEVLVIAVPALALKALVVERRPVVPASDVLRRLAPAALLIVAVIGWNARAGEPQDWGTFAHRLVFAVAGALLFSGGLKRWWTLGLFVLLPALASGLFRWTTGVDGQPAIVTDSTAWALSVAMFGGAAWIFVQPPVASGVRRLWAVWSGMLEADTARRGAARATRSGSYEAIPRASEPTASEPDGTVAALTRRGHAAPAANGGRHRQ